MTSKRMKMYDKTRAKYRIIPGTSEGVYYVQIRSFLGWYTHSCGASDSPREFNSVEQADKWIQQRVRDNLWPLAHTEAIEYNFIGERLK